MKCFTSASAQTFISSFSFRTPSAPPGRHHRETGARVGARGVGGRRAGVLLHAQDAAAERRGQPATRQSVRPKNAKTVLTRKTWHSVFQDLFLVEGNLGCGYEDMKNSCVVLGSLPIIQVCLLSCRLPRAGGEETVRSPSRRQREESPTPPPVLQSQQLQTGASSSSYFSSHTENPR